VEAYLRLEYELYHGEGFLETMFMELRPLNLK
jgi:hypothetical protein